MSLDVYLTVEEPVAVRCGPDIYVRVNGRNQRISRANWDELNPGCEPTVAIKAGDTTHVVFSANITHNLNTMAGEAGIYEELWRPDEIGISKAKQLIEPLTNGLQELKDDPAKFIPFEPENGWGTYGTLVGFVEEYLEACIKYPDATVEVSR